MKICHYSQIHVWLNKSHIEIEMCNFGDVILTNYHCGSYNNSYILSVSISCWEIRTLYPTKKLSYRLDNNNSYMVCHK